MSCFSIICESLRYLSCAYAPLAISFVLTMDANGMWYGLTTATDVTKSPPSVLIIGAGSRGNAYARAIVESTDGIVDAIAEPIHFKRQEFGRKYVWTGFGPAPGQEFSSWKDFLTYEMDRRRRAAAGEKVRAGVDALLICTLDTQHAEIIRSLAPLNLHMLCEKPLATTLEDCMGIYSSLLPDGGDSPPTAIFGIGHVLRYSLHNMLLRDLVLKQNVIGDIISVEHTEPIGYWHTAHSYVRGHWRKESTTAPSLLTKSCHDIDFLLWFLCSPASPTSITPPHLPATITSTGHLSYFRRSRKPPSAGAATNCLSCPVEPSCIYSAKKIYIERHLRHGKTDWPIKIVNPEIEDCYNALGADAAEAKLTASLAEDYDRDITPQATIDARPWFGRCVWESDNDVCDDQTVTMTWDDQVSPSLPTSTSRNARHAKTATFHMIAHTEAQCERRGRIYGTRGELSYDSSTIRIFDFATGAATVHKPPQRGGGHGGGDDGLAAQFVGAVAAVKRGEMGVDEAQKVFLGATLEEVIRSHAVVFAAEEARVQRKVVDWREWWSGIVGTFLPGKGGRRVAEVQKRVLDDAGDFVLV